VYNVNIFATFLHIIRYISKEFGVTMLQKESQVQNTSLKKITTKKRVIDYRDFNIVEKYKIKLVKATSKNQLKKVYKLRYDSYRAKNNIDPNDQEEFMDEYDLKPNAQNFLISLHGEYIGTYRILAFTEAEDVLPAMTVFNEELREIVSLGRKMIEIGRFAIDKKYEKMGITFLMPIFRSSIHQALENKAAHVIIAVNKFHSKLYQRMFRYIQIADEKKYPGVNFSTVLLYVNLKKAIREGKTQQPSLYKYLFKNTEKSLLLV